MAAVSTAPAVKAAVLALLAADATFTNVQLTYGFPRNVEREHVSLADVDYETDDWASMGQLRKDETYVIKSFVSVQSPGGTQKEATERAYALAGAVETVLSTRANVTTAGVHWITVRLRAVNEIPYDEGYQAILEMDLAVKARK